MKNKLWIATLLLAGTSAMAQSQNSLSSQTQIVQTRDFVSGLINRVSASNSSQFSVSADYARSGVALQSRFAQGLTQFKQMMDIMVQGPLASSIEQYNSLVRDGSVSANEKKVRTNSLYQSLTIQVKAAEATYQGALAQLYLIEPSWVIQSMKRKGDSKTIATWFDGTSAKYELDSSCAAYSSEYYPMYQNMTSWNDRGECLRAQVQNLIHNQMKISLFAACSSQACISSMIAAYSAYLNDVNQLVNQNLEIPLADGASITVRGLSANDGWQRYADLISAISSYQFDQDYLKLPFQIK